MYKTLVDSATLAQHLPDDNWLVVDCRYDLMHPQAGREAYLESHIAGAVYADVHDDLSGPPVTDHGRHPLPTAAALEKLFSRLGIDSQKQVIVYDATNGAFAARLWWLLRYMGHEGVALLDGGWKNWQQQQLAVSQGEQNNPTAVFSGTRQAGWLVQLDQVTEQRLLIDSRDPARYRGDSEPIDPAAGHIPGAINRFWQENLQADGRFKSAEQLHREFTGIYSESASDEPVFYCGSGVTACHNLLAVAHAGLPPARLYAGSWSEWCSDPQRPIASGE